MDYSQPDQAQGDNGQPGESMCDHLAMPDSTFFLEEAACLLRMAVRLGVSRADAEELVQEAWLDAVEHRILFAGAEGVRHFQGRMRRVVRNKVRDWQRRLYCCRFVSLPVESGALIDRAEEERQELAEDWQWLEAALAKGRTVSELNHRLLCEHVWEGRSFKELAQKYNLKECAVEGRIRRHRRKLRALAEGDSGSESDSAARLLGEKKV